MSKNRALYKIFFLFLIGFFALLMPHASGAQDFTPRCDGIDLRSTLAKTERKQIAQAAASVINGKGRFWKIERPGLAPSWLLGTMHVSDGRVTQFSTVEEEAFENADRLALELYFDNFTQNSETFFLQALAEYPEIFSYPQDNIIKNSIPAPQFALFEQVLKKRGLSYALLSRTKPWLIWMTLGSPPCLVAQTQRGHAGFDLKLGGIMQARHGKPVIGLEKVEEQLKAIDSLPLNFYISSIIQTGFVFDQLNNYHETMLKLYLEGEIGAIMPTLQALMMRDLEQAGLGDAEMPNPADMLSFETILLDKRNAIMAERAAPLLDEGNSFIAVGALHLVGETGLVEQFRRLGYQLTPVE